MLFPLVERDLYDLIIERGQESPNEMTIKASKNVLIIKLIYPFEKIVFFRLYHFQKICQILRLFL